MFVWALFAEMEKCARKFGAQRVELMVWSHNAIAQKAYAAYSMTLQCSIYEIALYCIIKQSCRTDSSLCGSFLIAIPLN